MIPPVNIVDECGRGIPDEERERRFVGAEEEQETVSTFISTLDCRFHLRENSISQN